MNPKSTGVTSDTFLLKITKQERLTRPSQHRVAVTCGRVQALPLPLCLGLPLYPSAERQGHGPDISQRSLQQITSNKAFRKAPLTTATERERERDGLQPWQQIQSAPIKSSLGETGSLDLIMITERRAGICI